MVPANGDLVFLVQWSHVHSNNFLNFEENFRPQIFHFSTNVHRNNMFNKHDSYAKANRNPTTTKENRETISVHQIELQNCVSKSEGSSFVSFFSTQVCKMFSITVALASTTSSN